MRAVPGIGVDRARYRTTAMVRALDWLQLGVEWNPAAQRASPLANAILLEESDAGPAVIAGTSSDRIGTPRGQAFYVTASKDLEHETGLPVAPYVGASFGTFDDELRAIGGVRVRWEGAVSTTHLFDGVNVHHMLNVRVADQHVLGVILVDGQDIGVSYSVSFGL